MFRLILTTIVFTFATVVANAKVFPSAMTNSERKLILPYFSNSYAQQVMTRPYFLGSKPGFEIGSSLSYKNLSDLEKKFPSENIRDELILTQLFIKKSLVHRLEITISSSLSSFGTTQASGFGGVLSWHPFDLNQFYFSPVVSVFTHYMNFEDTLSFQESGTQLILGKNFKNFSVKGGSSLTQVVARFSGKINGLDVTESGNSERNRIFVSTVFASVHFELDHYLITFTQNYVLNGGWNPNLILSYQF